MCGLTDEGQEEKKVWHVHAYQRRLHVGKIAVVAEKDSRVQVAQEGGIKVDALAFGLLAAPSPIQHTLPIHGDIGRHIACTRHKHIRRRQNGNPKMRKRTAGRLELGTG